MPISDIEQYIAGRLRNFRESLKIKQKEVADGSGSSQSHISAMEVGEKQIQPRVILFLAEKYHLNVDWLFTGAGEMLLNDRSSKTYPDPSMKEVVNESEVVYKVGSEGIFENVLRRLEALEEWRKEVEERGK